MSSEMQTAWNEFLESKTGKIAHMKYGRDDNRSLCWEFHKWMSPTMPPPTEAGSAPAAPSVPSLVGGCPPCPDCGEPLTPYCANLKCPRNAKAVPAGTGVGPVLAAIDRALEEVCRINNQRWNGKTGWRMSIPADPKTDSDLIIADALQAARASLQSLEGGAQPRQSPCGCKRPANGRKIPRKGNGYPECDWCDNCMHRKDPQFQAAQPPGSGEQADALREAAEHLAWAAEVDIQGGHRTRSFIQQHRSKVAFWIKSVRTILATLGKP